MQLLQKNMVNTKTYNNNNKLNVQHLQNIGYKGIFIDAYKLHRHGILPATLG